MKIILQLIIILTFTAHLSAQQDFKAYDQTVGGTPISMKMMPIPAGSFSMGSSEKDKGHEEDESPLKKVQIDSFWMAAYEMSFDIYSYFMVFIFTVFIVPSVFFELFNVFSVRINGAAACSTSIFPFRFSW